MNTATPAPTRALVPWIGDRSGGRSEGGSSPVHFDPRRHGDAPFFDLARSLDRIGWAAPLGRERPSWVFYDCALMPGSMFGFGLPAAAVPAEVLGALGVSAATAAYEGLVPLSMLALIPTIDGHDLVQSLTAVDLAGVTAEELANATLRAGMSALGAGTLTAAVPWRSAFLSRFLAVGPLRVRTAWTPAHDEPRTVTFSVAAGGIAATDDVFALDPEDDEALTTLQREVEQGATLSIVATSGRAFTLARGR